MSCSVHMLLGANVRTCPLTVGRAYLLHLLSWKQWNGAYACVVLDAPQIQTSFLLTFSLFSYQSDTEGRLANAGVSMSWSHPPHHHHHLPTFSTPPEHNVHLTSQNCCSHFNYVKIAKTSWYYCACVSVCVCAWERDIYLNGAALSVTQTHKHSHTS